MDDRTPLLAAEQAQHFKVIARRRTLRDSARQAVLSARSPYLIWAGFVESLERGSVEGVRLGHGEPWSSQAEVMLVRNVLVFCSLSNMTPSISCFETTSQRDIWATQEGHQFLSDGNEFMCIFRARAQVDATRHFTMQA